MEKKTLHFKVKYQDGNVVIVRFEKKDIDNIMRDSVVWIETGENPNAFWECLEDSLLGVEGVLFTMMDGYEIVVVKKPTLKWGNIVGDVIWSILCFFDFEAAIQVSKMSGKVVREPITHRFDGIGKKKH